MYITASKLYDYLQCPHKVWRDAHGPREERIEETNPFVEMLWRNGIKHEEKVVKQIGTYLDLGEGSIDERYLATSDAMKDGVPLIYQGVLKYENLLGVPDLLKRLPDGMYIPIDIKSGMALEGTDEKSDDLGKPKKHYAVQLCLYNELLKQLGFSDHHRGMVIDIRGNEVVYDLLSPMGVRNKTTWMECYVEVKQHVEALLRNSETNKPATASACKMCHWCNSCKSWCTEHDDLTQVFYVGRSVRDTINRDLGINKPSELLGINIDEVMNQKKKEKSFLPRIARKSLAQMTNRANILLNIKKPVLHEPIHFPDVSHELFLDIEDDPTQEFVYLHGILERGNSCETYIYFVAEETGLEAEREAWKNLWHYIASLPQSDFSVYYYSHHEKTTYKKLQSQYPEIVQAAELEAFFASSNVIDLYQEVYQHTDWPIGSYSLKEIATFLGFKWRDETPSGALSILWFNEYLESGDPDKLKRILMYNEDDCRATIVLKDKLGELNSAL